MRRSYQRATQPGDTYVFEAERLLKRRRDHEAEAFLRSGLELHPENARMWHAMGKTLRHKREHNAETLDCFAKSYALEPSDKYTAMDYARFMTQIGHFDRAESVYARVYKEEGASTALLTVMGNHYQKRAIYDLAAATFGRAMILPDADTYCHDRYMEIAEKYDTRFDGSNWQAFEERMARCAAAPLPEPAPAPSI